MAGKTPAKKTTRKAAPKRKAATTRGGTTVRVGRFGSDPVSITVSGNATVGEVLEAAKISLGTKETVWLNGSRAKVSDRVRSNDIVSIVTPREAGKV